MQQPGSASARTLRPKPGRQLDRQEQLSIIHSVGDRRLAKPAPEQQAGYRHHRQLAGSSLRVRGTESLYRKRKFPASDIPACAGNRGARRDDLVRRTGHPCVCGEQRCPARQSGCGVIPACAGNRGEGPPPRAAGAGHPCVCGEQTLMRARVRPIVGSSLRVRGTGRGRRTRAQKVRVIPACAGNRLCELVHNRV